jgi:hypothetical protein
MPKSGNPDFGWGDGHNMLAASFEGRATRGHLRMTGNKNA